MFAVSLAVAAALTAVPVSDGWRVQRADGTALLEQHAAADHRAYIHPLMAPDGKGVYTENEPKHHPWQHGLYVGRTSSTRSRWRSRSWMGTPRSGR